MWLQSQKARPGYSQGLWKCPFTPWWLGKWPESTFLLTDILWIYLSRELLKSEASGLPAPKNSFIVSNVCTFTNTTLQMPLLWRVLASAVEELVYPRNHISSRSLVRLGSYRSVAQRSASFVQLTFSLLFSYSRKVYSFDFLKHIFSAFLA